MSDEAWSNDMFFIEQAIQQKTTGSTEVDEDGLPAESFDMSSELPLNFEEMASGLRKDLFEVYELTGKLNRFSKNYPECCRLLEKLIKRVGSCLVTKAALEQKGFNFPGFEGLNITELYCMVSFNFRKTRTAFHEGKRKNGCADLGLLIQECRLVDLAEQLKSTEEKIRQIAAGKINIESMLERVNMYKGQKGISRPQQNGQQPVSTQAHSLPIISSVIRKMIRDQKAREKEEREWNRFLEKDSFAVKTFKPMSLKGFSRQQIEKDPSRSAETVRTEKSQRPAEQKNNNIVNKTVDKMLNSRKKNQTEPDAKLDKELDESLHRVFNVHKRFMSSGGKKAPLPERA